MNRLIATTAISGCLYLLLPSMALADCSVFQSDPDANLSGDARCVVFNSGDGESLRAGDSSGGLTGSISVTNGAVVDIEAGDPTLSMVPAPFMAVGREPGNTGTAMISGDGSAINLLGENGGAAIHIGREGTGTVTVQDGGALNVVDTTPNSDATDGESLTVGLDGGIGTLTVDDATVSITGGEGAFLFVGREAGNGTVNLLNGSDLTVTDSDTGASAAGASISIGRDIDQVFGSTGEMTVVNSTVTVHSEQGLATINAGRDFGTTGELILEGASTLVRVDSGVQAGMTIGRDNGSFGDLTVTDGATLEFDAPNTFLQLGRDAGSTGVAEITGGGTIRVLGPASESDVLIGGAGVDLARPEGGNGTMTVSGAGSSLEATGQVLVGAPESLGGGTSLGRLTIEDGGTVTASEVFIGTGGVLDGDGGTIAGNLVLDGGTISPGASPGTLNVQGDFSVLGGLLDIEIGGTAPGTFDIINVLGDFIGTDPFDVRLTFIDAFVPTAGDRFDFLTVVGDTSALESLFATSSIEFAIAGLDPGSTFDLAFGNGTLSAVTRSATAVIPIPPALPLLLAGLGMMALTGRRRRAA